MNKGDILDILLVMAIAALAIGISAAIEHAFYEYVFDADQVEEQHVGWDSSYCRSSISMQTGSIQWDCRKITTPKMIQLMRGSKVVAKV